MSRYSQVPAAATLTGESESTHAESERPGPREVQIGIRLKRETSSAGEDGAGMFWVRKLMPISLPACLLRLLLFLISWPQLHVLHANARGYMDATAAPCHESR